MTLTKFEISEYLFSKIKLSKQDSKKIVELFFKEIKQTLKNNEQVKLSGFGNFNLRDKNQRLERNLKIGASTLIFARKVVTFRSGQKFKNRIEKKQIMDNK